MTTISDIFANIFMWGYVSLDFVVLGPYCNMFQNLDLCCYGVQIATSKTWTDVAMDPQSTCVTLRTYPNF